MLSKKYRLTKNGSYNYVYRKGQNKGDKLLSLAYVPGKGTVRIGFSVPNKVGKAVVRNRLKRRLRAIAAPLLPFLKPSQIVVGARAGADKLTFAELKENFSALLRRADLLKGKQGEEKFPCCESPKKDDK